MTKYHIHTARKVFTTTSYVSYHASLVSGVVPSSSKYLDVKYIEIEYPDGRTEIVYPER